MAQEELQKYRVFICYYTRTGIGFAKYLKHGLRDLDISAFFAKEDIPKIIKKNTDKWRKYVDCALKKCSKFVLIMTLGFNNRPEIKREFKLARKLGKDIIHCKYTDMPKDDLKIKIDGDFIDLSEYNYIEFKDKHDLLNKLGLLLIHGIKPKIKREGDVFLNHAYKIIRNEGRILKQTSEAQLEIVIGSDNLENIWLNPNNENKLILFGHFFRPKRITTRRYFFEFLNICENEYLKIYTNGFYHIIIPIHSEALVCSLESIIYDILSHLIYFIRFLNFKKVQNDQFILIIFRNISSIVFTLGSLWRNKYSFPKDKYDVSFFFHFTPNLKWDDYKKLFIYIFKDIFLELGIDDVKDTFIEKTLKSLVSTIVNHVILPLNITMYNISIPRIDIKDFKFNK